MLSLAVAGLAILVLMIAAAISISLHFRMTRIEEEMGLDIGGAAEPQRIMTAEEFDHLAPPAPPAPPFLTPIPTVTVPHRAYPGLHTRPR